MSRSAAPADDGEDAEVVIGTETDRRGPTGTEGWCSGAEQGNWRDGIGESSTREPGVVSKFEDDLHEAAQSLPYEAAEAPESVWRRFRERNEPARIEAKRRLREIAADVRNFLTKQGVPPQQVVVSLGGTHSLGEMCAEVCQAWNFTSYFLVKTGQFCTIRPGYPAINYAHLVSQIKPDQLYLGKHGTMPPVEEYLPGAERAVFVPGKPPQTHFGEHEFLPFYYGDLYRPSLKWGAPKQALLLTSATPELWLATDSDLGHGISVGRLDEMFANKALQLVEAHRNGRPPARFWPGSYLL
jgi:hypothetical protein